MDRNCLEGGITPLHRHGLGSTEPSKDLKIDFLVPIEVNLGRKISTQCRIRTHNLPLACQMLYQPGFWLLEKPANHYIFLSIPLLIGQAWGPVTYSGDTYLKTRSKGKHPDMKVSVNSCLSQIMPMI